MCHLHSASFYRHQSSLIVIFILLHHPVQSASSVFWSSSIVLHRHLHPSSSSGAVYFVRLHGNLPSSVILPASIFSSSSFTSVVLSLRNRDTRPSSFIYFSFVNILFVLRVNSACLQCFCLCVTVSVVPFIHRSYHPPSSLTSPAASPMCSVVLLNPLSTSPILILTAQSYFISFSFTFRLSCRPLSSSVLCGSSIVVLPSSSFILLFRILLPSTSSVIQVCSVRLHSSHSTSNSLFVVAPLPSVIVFLGPLTFSDVFAFCGHSRMLFGIHLIIVFVNLSSHAYAYIVFGLVMLRSSVLYPLLPRASSCVQLWPF